MTSDRSDDGSGDALPGWRSVLAVVAHPDDESFGLGAVLDAFVRAGAQARVLCLTHGEASTVHGVSGELRSLRADELQRAARILGIATATMGDHPDGSLGAAPAAVLADVLAAAGRSTPDGFLVFDLSGVTGHPDHVAATEAALAVAERLDLPVLAWTLPEHVATALNDETGAAFVGQLPAGIDLTVTVDRTTQRIACLEHASQAIPTSILWRRLDLLADVEHLRWLRRAH
jgi:LmbE family N-acetylglucosaminyl deacetylase